MLNVCLKQCCSRKALIQLTSVLKSTFTRKVNQMKLEKTTIRQKENCNRWYYMRQNSSDSYKAPQDIKQNFTSTWLMRDNDYSFFMTILITVFRPTKYSFMGRSCWCDGEIPLVIYCIHSNWHVGVVVQEMLVRTNENFGAINWNVVRVFYQCVLFLQMFKKQKDEVNVTAPQFDNSSSAG